MSRIRFPEAAKFHEVPLVAEDRECQFCAAFLHVRETKHRYVWSFAGATHLIIRLLHCPDTGCRGHKMTVGTEVELAVALPYWSATWDVFAWMGHRRFARHWSVPQIREELQDRFHIETSADWIEDYLGCYQAMVAAREADLDQWAADYEDVDDVCLTIDGLQPEKGHETLYVVRELRAKRVWFAQPLLSSSTQEVRTLFARAKQMAEKLGKPVRCWMSDKQDAFVKGIAQEFPGVPHRYCANHFLRDLAKPVLELDSHAKVQMRRKVRGLRDIEKRLLEQTALERDSSGAVPDAPPVPSGLQDILTPAEVPSADAQRKVVLDYCGAVRGILNDDQGGPIHPPGLRMAQALEQVDQSIQRTIAEDGGCENRALTDLHKCIERGISLVAAEMKAVEAYAVDVKQVHQLLGAEAGAAKTRSRRFATLAAKYGGSSDPIYAHMGRTMQSFHKGLFAGGDDPDLPQDNLELERTFRLPKSHERRIHGHAHAGVRIVQQGASLMLVLDAHTRQTEPFATDALSPYANIPFPDAQLESQRRRKIMRLARSTKQRPILLASLEARYRASIQAT